MFQELRPKLFKEVLFKLGCLGAHLSRLLGRPGNREPLPGRVADIGCREVLGRGHDLSVIRLLLIGPQQPVHEGGELVAVLELPTAASSDDGRGGPDGCHDVSPDGTQEVAQLAQSISLLRGFHGLGLDRLRERPRLDAGAVLAPTDNVGDGEFDGGLPEISGAEHVPQHSGAKGGFEQADGLDDLVCRHALAPDQCLKTRLHALMQLGQDCAALQVAGDGALDDGPGVIADAILPGHDVVAQDGGHEPGLAFLRPQTIELRLEFCRRLLAHRNQQGLLAWSYEKCPFLRRDLGRVVENLGEFRVLLRHPVGDPDRLLCDSQVLGVTDVVTQGDGRLRAAALGPCPVSVIDPPTLRVP